ncbi:MAG: isoleucine--tRNA ligase [Patescibacteria group bacterium]|nr:isoleucine--tRNA ligase [Patescibacteria group bacterium]MCL5431741.1 isoleucine--tRNA ligase [Patescibacteria group bacterium]
MFKPVDPKVNFAEMEKGILAWWDQAGVVNKYLHKNDQAKKKFSFLDGPITANNPMGVHHAWGRTYKDLWQRYHNMLGEKGRFQNGFDCQGLWVEVEVEKELGFKSKKDIETYGIANFVNKCKERVIKYSGIQTEQSKRLGYFMDWDHSYFTMSEENNYAIWNFLKVCADRGWIYKGHESIPWCPRCETAISQHEILTEDYKEITHESIILEFPIVGHDREFLLVWTTTPWTIPANIAVAVDEKQDYSLVKGGDGNKFWLAKNLVDSVFKNSQKEVLKTVKGRELAGLKYTGPFDDLEAVAKAAKENETKFHIVVPTDDQIMPISMEEGTGLVHTAVSAGEEDFKLGKKLGLPMIPVIADNADYLPGLGRFSGQNAKKNPRLILDYLEEREKSGKDTVFSIFSYTHRYPACWRCKTELVWKVADEWYIAMDRPDKSGKTLREQLKTVTKKINWRPAFGLDRELDWLENMHDWLISKKNRYWGLALPIYECLKCGHFEVIRSKEELKKRAVSGWEKFEGNTPHRPWIDEVKIKCTGCGEVVSRILDVGNPWLDAGIVSVSTMPQDWFPADFITESFPGQFKNWFYSLIVMGMVLRKTNPFKTVLGFGTLLGEDGRPMHKSWGNSIEFNEGADKIGVDVMRWMYATHQPEENLLFGYRVADETRRKFHLMLWNVYNFFVTYANLSGWDNSFKRPPLLKLDEWILVRLEETINKVTKSLDQYDAYRASTAIAAFVEDLSLWYVRRSRDRLGPEFFNTCYRVLVTLCQLLAPFTPFIAEEMYKNLTGEESVHLTKWPRAGKQESRKAGKLIEEMTLVRKVCEIGHAKRKEAGIKVRQPLAKFTIFSPPAGRAGSQFSMNDQLIQLIKDELNVKEVVWKKGEELAVELDTKLTPELEAEGRAREIVRQIQDARKEAGTALDQKISVTLPDWPAAFTDYIKKETLAIKLTKGDKFEIA